MRLSELNVIEENLEKKLPCLVDALKKWFKGYGSNASKFAIAQDEDPAAVIEGIIHDIAAADPIAVKSGNRKTPFVNQILKWFITDTITLPEDIETVRDVLTKFNEASHHQGFDHKLEEFKSPGALRKALASNESESKGYPAEVVFDNGDIKVHEIKTWSEAQACFTDSGWCVQHREHFNEYGPPFFMVVDAKNNKRLALIHMDYKQVKDVHDDTINDPALVKRLIPIVEDIFDLDTIFDPAFEPYSSTFYNNKDLVPFIPFDKGLYDAIKFSAGAAARYAKQVGKRWIDFDKDGANVERIIMASYDPIDILVYARDVIKGRWPEAEPYLLNYYDSQRYSSQICAAYAQEVIRKRWPEGEPMIQKNDVAWQEYKKWLQHRKDLHLDEIPN